MKRKNWNATNNKEGWVAYGPFSKAYCKKRTENIPIQSAQCRHIPFLDRKPVCSLKPNSFWEFFILEQEFNSVGRLLAQMHPAAQPREWWPAMMIRPIVCHLVAMCKATAIANPVCFCNGPASNLIGKHQVKLSQVLTPRIHYSSYILHALSTD